MAPVIAVCGAGRCGPDLAALAEAVGRELAQKGATVVCGGHGGVMEAAARGAVEAGGMTIGVLPGRDRREANPFIRAVVATGMGEARNAIIVRTADAVIAVGGEYGTLSEMALALKMGKPVVSLQSWMVSDEIVAAKDPAEAVALALARV